MSKRVLFMKRKFAVSSVKVSLITSLAGFVLYILSLSPGPCPGESARILAAHAGLNPFPLLSNPLWQLLVLTVKQLSFLPFSLTMNVLSSLFAFGALYLFHRLARRVYLFFFKGRPGFTADVAATAATLLLSCSSAFWIVSNRAFPDTFGLCLVFAFAHRIMTVLERPAELSQGYLMKSAFFAGIVMTESVSTAVLAPMIWLFFAYYMLKLRKTPGLDRVWLVISSSLFKSLWPMLAGLLPVLLTMGVFYHLRPVSTWVGFDSIFPVLLHTVKMYYFSIKGALSGSGWIIILLSSYVPLMVFASPTRITNSEEKWRTLFLLLLFFAVGVLNFVEWKLSPAFIGGLAWPMTMPYVSTALWFGGLIFYFLESGGRALFRHALTERIARYLLLGAVVLLPVVMIYMNWDKATAGKYGLVQRYLDDMAASLDDVEWLVTDGRVDDALYLRLYEKGLDVQLLNMRYASHKPYLNYATHSLEDPSLANMAQMGLVPLMQEWIGNPAHSVDAIAVQTMPDFWLYGGYDALPRGVVYRGKRLREEIAVDGTDKNRQLYQQYTGYSIPQDTFENEYVLKVMSRLANDSGVFIDASPADVKEKAKDLYELSIQIYSNNISALLNRLTVADLEDSPEKDAWKEQLDAALERMKGRMPSWSMARHFGYINRPEFYARRGLTWAISGKMNSGIEDIKRAVKLGLDSDSADMMIAGLLFEEDPEQSRELYQRIVLRDTENIAALTGLMRIEASMGNYEVALSYMDRVKSITGESSFLDLNLAVIETINGRPDRARTLVRKVIENEPNNRKAWTLLTLLAIETQDEALESECLQFMEERSNVMPAEVLWSLGRRSIKKGNLENAVAYYQQLLSMNYRREQVLDLLMRLSGELKRTADTQNYAEAILKMSPRNAFANYIRGTLYISKEEYALSIPYLRISVEEERHPDYLNALAYALCYNDAFDEALSLAEEAVERDSENGHNWDTLGMVWLHFKEWDKAEKALLKALGEIPTNPEVKLHVSQLYAAQGKREQALALLDEVIEDSARISITLFSEARDLANSLRRE